MSVISIYAPDDKKPKQERDMFYDQLQEVIEALLHDEQLIILL